jgi:hypothetical protein
MRQGLSPFGTHRIDGNQIPQSSASLAAIRFRLAGARVRHSFCQRMLFIPELPDPPVRQAAERTCRRRNPIGRQDRLPNREHRDLRLRMLFEQFFDCGGPPQIKFWDAKPRRSAEAGQGLLPLANDADRGEPQPKGLTVKPVSGGLSATDCAQISRCASGTGGGTCHIEAARMGWRGVLAQRTPPIRSCFQGIPVDNPCEKILRGLQFLVSVA